VNEQLTHAPKQAASPASRYDRVTMTFHWLTALCLVTLFGAAYWWNALPGGTPLRKGLQAFHISIGLLFVVVFVGRLVWRATSGRKLVAANGGIAGIAAKVMHALLYLLLAAQITLGFALRWAQGEPFFFFGLFSIPQVFTPDKATSKLFEMLHNDVAWAIIYLAGAHAIAALVHHYVLRDAVLARMVSIRRT
jgi:cytochrome b561